MNDLTHGARMSPTIRVTLNAYYCITGNVCGDLEHICAQITSGFKHIASKHAGIQSAHYNIYYFNLFTYIFYNGNFI